jgi:hypothetical protein
MTVEELIEILKDADPDATVSIKYSIEDPDEDTGYRDEFVARLALQLYQIYDKQRSEASAALKREKQMHHCLEYNRKLLALEDKIQKIPSLCADELTGMASYAPNLA